MDRSKKMSLNIIRIFLGTPNNKHTKAYFFVKEIFNNKPSKPHAFVLESSILNISPLIDIFIKILKIISPILCIILVKSFILC